MTQHADDADLAPNDEAMARRIHEWYAAATPAPADRARALEVIAQRVALGDARRGSSRSGAISRTRPASTPTTWATSASEMDRPHARLAGEQRTDVDAELEHPLRVLRGSPAGARRRTTRRRTTLVAWSLAAAVALIVFRVAMPPAARESVTVAARDEASPAAAGALATREIAFALHLSDPAVRGVTLAGDFNGWNATAIPLRRDGAGDVWRVRVALPPGRHAYSFVVDGTRWVIDPLAPRTDEGALGETNVIAVGDES